jgi:hypothetical protein
MGVMLMRGSIGSFNGGKKQSWLSAFSKSDAMSAACAQNISLLLLIKDLHASVPAAILG